MRKIPSLIATMTAAFGALTLGAALVADAAGAEIVVTPVAPPLAGSMNKLGSETLGRLVAHRGDKTVVVSPYGLGSALHLLSLGAAGSAEKSLRAKLLPSGVDAGKQGDGLIVLKRQILGASRDRLKLTMASAIFVPKSATPSPRFVGTARGVFDTSLEALDFKSTNALERINAWAKEATHGLIPHVVEQLDPDARFVLANAIYFNGAWDTAFDVARTAKAPFTRIDGSARDAAMMDATMPTAFAEFDNLQAVWLPYDGKDISMLVIAPGPQRGPAEVSEALKRQSLDVLMAAAFERRRMASVQVRLPRFRAESNLDITDALARQRLAPALSARSDYRAINKAKGGPLVVSHRAVLEVTEAGTKAAAATTITTDRSLALPPIVFSADRPFAFAIVHRATQAILFAGYIADPGDGPGPAPAEPKIVR